MPKPSAFDASFLNLPADTRNRARPPVLDTASAAYVHGKTLVRRRNGATGTTVFRVTFMIGVARGCE